MKVLIYPRGDNPYQELLYRELRKNIRDQYVYVESTPRSIILFPFIMLVKRLQGFRIVHLHWLNFQTNILKIFGGELSLILTLWSLTWLNLLGYRIVWTVHNVLPHEQITSNDKLVSRYLARMADAKIVHSQYTIGQIERLNMNTEHITIIPHGNYVGVYQTSFSVFEARKYLGVNQHDIIILFFGSIRPYKGLDDLLKAFSLQSDKNICLLIAGKGHNQELLSMINDFRKRCNVVFHNQYIADKDVATYFKASDIVCLPFKDITTSGSALLALSFGKPIIAPLVGSLQDYPSDLGYLYDATEQDALPKIMSLALCSESSFRRKGANGLSYAKTLDWEAIAKKTRKVYLDILSRSRKAEI